MTTELSLITSTVKPYAPDCLEPVIEQFIHLAAVELCRKSLKWIKFQNNLSVDSVDFPYTIPVLNGTRVVKILSVVVNGTPIVKSDVYTEESLDGNWRTTTGVPERFVEESSGVLILVPLPVEETVINVSVALEPSATGTFIDDTLYAEHWTDIQAGAISKLCSMPGKPWTDLKVSIYYRDIFDRGIENAKSTTHLNYRVGGISSSLFEL